MSIAGKVVLITGGARGMGREMVRAFLKEGAKVIATDISWAPTGLSNDDFDFLAEIKDHPNVITGVMDVMLQSHVDDIYEEAMEKFGTIDVIINNGGPRQPLIYLRKGGIVSILETDVSEWERMFGTHVFGILRVIKAFVRPMIEQRSGSIINSSSSQLLNAHGAGQGEATGYGLSREGSYQPAKAAMGSMTIYLAQELKQYNIAANVILPGRTATTGTDDGLEMKRQIRERLGLAASSPRRVRADNVVPLALHLAEQDASGITGQWIGCMDWNEKNGLGGFETWGYAPDLAALRAQGQL